MAKKLRIGIIGTGGIAHAHANAYKTFNDVEVLAGAAGKAHVRDLGGRFGDHACGKLEGDIILDYRMAWAMHMDICSDFVILGTDAGLKATAPHPNPLWGSIIDGNLSGLYLMHDQCGEPVTTPLTLEPTNGNIFTIKVRDFLDAVQNNRPAPIPTSQIIYNQAIIDAMLISAREKQEIKIDIPEI